MNKEQKESLKIVVYLLIAITIIYLSFEYFPGRGRDKCPYKVQGNPDADFVIKYVDSPYCIWCWAQEPILSKMLDSKGDLFKLEKYDIRYCTEMVNEYGFSGTPSFVFSVDNGTKEFLHFGYIDLASFKNVICEVTGDCKW